MTPNTIHLADTPGALAIELREVARRALQWRNGHALCDERLDLLVAVAEDCASALVEQQALGHFRRRGRLDTLADVADDVETMQTHSLAIPQLWRVSRDLGRIARAIRELTNDR